MTTTRRCWAAGVPIDVVHVCTPPYTHAEIAIHSMDAGKNVVVEKPMATCLKECDEMLAAEERNHVTMGCIAQNRFRDSIYKLRETLNSGLAGKLRVAHVNSLWWRGHCYYDLWWRGLWEKEGGGCTLNHAVHHIDMINWMKGELPKGDLHPLQRDARQRRGGGPVLLHPAVRRRLCGPGDGLCGPPRGEQGVELQCEKAKIAAPWSATPL